MDDLYFRVKIEVAYDKYEYAEKKIGISTLKIDNYNPTTISGLGAVVEGLAEIAFQQLLNKYKSQLEEENNE